MNTSARYLALGASVLTLTLLCMTSRTSAGQKQSSIVRVAELEIDPAQLEAYKAELRQEIETSIRVEPGVLALYAVALKENPTQIRLFENYADASAYKAHLESPHFKRYKAATQGMVKSLKLLETDPIFLGTKAK